MTNEDMTSKREWGRLLAKLHEKIQVESPQVMCVFNTIKKHEPDLRKTAFALGVGKVADSIKSLGLRP